MLATLVVPVALAGVTFVLYRCGVREGCRWAAWLAALVMAAGSFTVLHVFERGLTAGVLLESLVLVMAGGGHSAAKGQVVVWNVKTGERLFTVGDELDAVLGADISADQTRIALGSSGKIVRIYSTADGAVQSEIKKHTDWVYCCAFSPDGVLLASGDRIQPTAREQLRWGAIPGWRHRGT